MYIYKKKKIKDMIMTGQTFRRITKSKSATDEVEQSQIQWPPNLSADQQVGWTCLLLRRSADTVAVLGGQRATASKEIGDVAVKYIKEKCGREMGKKKKERKRERG